MMVIPRTKVVVRGVDFNLDLGADELIQDTEEEYQFLIETESIMLAYTVNELLGPLVTIYRLKNGMKQREVSEVYLFSPESFKFVEGGPADENEISQLKGFLLNYEKVVRRNVWQIFESISNLAFTFLPK